MFCMLPLAAWSDVSTEKRLEAIRAFAAGAVTVETTAGPGTPNYQVIRLNTQTQEHEGERYGAVRLKMPEAGIYTLVILFSDVGNIVEYEMMSVREGTAALRGNTRFIHPAIVDHDQEGEAETSDLTLPKPWDHFELHLLGFGPDLLKTGEEYVLWFRFADKQPADILFAATLLKGPVDIAPEKLPGILGLPKPEHE